MSGNYIFEMVRVKKPEVILKLEMLPSKRLFFKNLFPLWIPRQAKNFLWKISLTAFKLASHTRSFSHEYLRRNLKITFKTHGRTL